jgi:hypothetical protein
LPAPPAPVAGPVFSRFGAANALDESSPAGPVHFAPEGGNKASERPLPAGSREIAMEADKRFEKGFAELHGRASGFGDPEFAEIIRDESEVPGTGLTVSALQSVAQRQLIGSIVVLAIIVVCAALTAFRPVHTTSIAAVSRPFANIQQPIIEAPNDRLAAIKRKTELP